MEIVLEEFDITETIHVQYGLTNGPENTTIECIDIKERENPGSTHDNWVKSNICSKGLNAVWFNAVAKVMRDNGIPKGYGYHGIFTQLNNFMWNILYDGSPIESIYQVIASFIVNHHKEDYTESIVIGSLDYFSDDVFDEDQKLELRNLYNYVSNYTYAYRVMIRKHTPINEDDAEVYCVIMETYAHENLQRRWYINDDYDVVEDYDSSGINDFESTKHDYMHIAAGSNIAKFSSYFYAVQFVTTALFDDDVEPEHDEWPMHLWLLDASNNANMGVHDTEHYHELMHKYFTMNHYAYNIPGQDNGKQPPALVSFQFVNYV